MSAAPSVASAPGPSRPKPLPFPPEYVSNVLSPAEESDAALFLATLDSFVDPRYYPPPHVVQLALHLATSENAPNLAALPAPWPLSSAVAAHARRVLDKLAAMHPARLEAGLPRVGVEVDSETHGKLERTARRRMARCGRAGVWELLWARDERAADPGEDDDGEGGGGGGRAASAVSDDGWAVLVPLVAAWEAAPPDAFAAQLTRLDRRLAYDNAAAPLAVVRQAFAAGSNTVTRQAGARLVRLLVRLAQTSPPLFHPHALAVSVVAMVRDMPTPTIPKFLFALADLPPTTSTADPAASPFPPTWPAAAYLAALLVEDAAGVREAKARERRREDRGAFEHGQWSAPRVAYVAELLALDVGGGGGDGDGSGWRDRPMALVTAKTSLLRLMRLHRDDDDDWVLMRDEAYLASLPGGDGGMLRAMLREV